MPYEFRGENLVEVPAPEVTGYNWQQVGGYGADATPEYRWVQDPNFDINSLFNIKTDKYGRDVYSLKEDASEADKRAYNLAKQGYDLGDWTVTSGNTTGIDPEWSNKANQGWFDVDPAIQEAWQAANRANSGNAVGMSGFGDWITPLAIIGGGLATAALAPAAAAAAPAWDASFAYGAGALPEAASGALGTGLTTGTGGANGLLNAGAGGAFSPSGAAATQSALGLGGTGTGIIEGLVPSSVGMAGTAGAGSLAGIAGAEAAAGLGSLGTGLTAEQLAQYEAGSLGNTGTTVSDALKTANQVRQGLGTANSIAKLLGGTGAGATGISNANLGQLASLLRPTAQTNDYLGQYKMNQNPFTFTSAGQTAASPGMYDVSGSNLANALRKA